MTASGGNLDLDYSNTWTVLGAFQVLVLNLVIYSIKYLSLPIKNCMDHVTIDM